MAKFNSVEEVHKVCGSMPEHEFDALVLDLSTPYKHINIPLYHVSLVDDLSGEWEPRQPYKNKDDDDDDDDDDSSPEDEKDSEQKDPPGKIPGSDYSIWAELLPPRISVSPTIEGCFRGVFMN